MDLIFDIGNTNIKCVIMDGEKITSQWRLNTDTNRTGDEYFATLATLFAASKIDVAQINSSVISSVVPPLTDKICKAAENIISKKPLVISPEIYDKLPIKLLSQAHVPTLGTDLLCDALAAWEKFHAACIIADFGTALSFVAIDSSAHIAGVAIAPGVGTAMKALASNAAQLPEIPLVAPPFPLGTNTIEAIQSGVVLGYKCLAEGMILALKADLAQKANVIPENIRTMATGGLSTVIAPLTNVFDFIDPEATLKGIAQAGKFGNLEQSCLNA